MQITSNNYISIKSFMVTDLKLKGNELLAYAIIYGFCEDKKSTFAKTNKYISEWLNCSIKTVINVLNLLVKKGLICKIVTYPYDNCTEITANEYMINFKLIESCNIKNTRCNNG